MKGERGRKDEEINSIWEKNIIVKNILYIIKHARPKVSKCYGCKLDNDKGGGPLATSACH